MKIKSRLFAAAMVTLSCAHAASLSVTASVMRVPGDFSRISQQNSVSGDFLLSFSGGTGSGLFFPQVDLRGGTNESHGTFMTLGGQASLTGFAVPFMTTGDFTDPAFRASDLSFSCALNPACYLPFTYGQTQLVHIVATGTVAVQANHGAMDPGFTAATASASFDGIVILTPDGRPASGAIGTAALLPEPSTGFPVFGGLVAAILLRKSLAKKSATG